MINDMIGHIKAAIGQMEGLRHILLKLPKSARKNMLMDAMDDYLAELNNTLSNMDQSNKIVAANLLSAFEDNKVERHSVRDIKKKAWGGLSVNGKIVPKWDLATDWLTMTNDMFFEKYQINWVPTIKLQDDVKAFMNKYGNITEDDLKKPYGATGKIKAPLQGESCITKPIRADTIRDFTMAEKAFSDITRTEMKEEYQVLEMLKVKINKERPSGITQKELNILGGLNTPNYNLYR